MPGDEAENKRRLIVGVEIGPVHGDDGIAARADRLLIQSGSRAHTSMPWLLKRRSTCLIECFPAFPRACAIA